MQIGRLPFFNISVKLKVQNCRNQNWKRFPLKKKKKHFKISNKILIDTLKIKIQYENKRTIKSNSLNQNQITSKLGMIIMHKP